MPDNKSELDIEFISACMRSDFDRARDLAEHGADVQTLDSSGKSGLHHAIGEIARRWPQNVDCIDAILSNGGDINQMSSVGTPMHMLASISGIHNSAERETSCQAFLREAVENYEGDLLQTKPNGRADGAVIVGFVRVNKGLCPVLKTALSLVHEQGEIDGKIRAEMGARWLTDTPAGGSMADHAPWWAAGVEIDAVKGNFSHISLGKIKAEYGEWQTQNPVLDPADVSGLSQLFAATEADPEAKTLAGRVHSPLFNQKNWDNLDALLESCAAKGAPLTVDDVLKPVAEDRNLIQIAAEVTCRPRQAIELCQERGFALGAQELLNEDGTANPTLQSLIDAKAAHLLFTPQNWRGKPREEMQDVYRALPELDQQMVHGFNQLRAMLKPAEHCVGR